MECSKKIWESVRTSVQVGRRALAILLSAAVMLCALPVVRISASASEVSENKGFSVIAYDQSVRVQIPMVSGAANYRVYLSTAKNADLDALNADTGKEKIFDSGYVPYAYAVNGDNSVSISPSTAYYFYFVTNNGGADTLQGAFQTTTRATADCYWTSPGLYDSGWYAGHEGDSTYTISTAAQLAGLAVLVNGLNKVTPVDFSGKTVKLGASVDLSANLWTPIGMNDQSTHTMHPFSGTFDGEKKLINGLHTNDGRKGCQGLFGCAESTSMIENISLVNGSVKGNQAIGGVVGSSVGSILNCYNTGAVSGTSGNVGGIAGSDRGAVTNCYNIGSVSGMGFFVGGIAGYVTAVTNCYNIGSVSGSGKNVGGIAGQNGGPIQNCYNIGAINGSSSQVGGITGSSSGKITDCYNTGIVCGTGDTIGGITGFQYYTGNIINCHNTGAVSGAGSEIGGISGFNNGAIFSNCYNTGSVCGTGSASQYVGGVVGKNQNQLIRECYSISTVSSTGDNVGGVAGQDDCAAIFNCYSIGSVSGTGSNVGGTVGSVTGWTSLVQNSYSVGNVKIGNGGSIPTYLYYNSTNSSRVPDTIAATKEALTSAISPSSNSYYCAAPTAYAAGGVFSSSNPVNQGYPVLKSFGYTDSTNGGGFAPTAITINESSGIASIGTDYGDGTSDHPYIIRNAYQMDLVRNYLGGNSGKSFQLAGNIDLSPTQYCQTQAADGSWKSIGSDTDKFAGIFDGKGYSVTGIYINHNSNGNNYQGLFGYTGTGSTIENVGMSNVDIKGTLYVGGVAGYVNQSGVIKNCYNTGVVSGNGGNACAGGVAGYSDGAITGCYNIGTVSGSGNNPWVGGVVGNSAGSVRSCYNIGTVIGRGEYSWVGGVAGDSAGNVTGCYNTGTVSGTDYVGGIVGNTAPVVGGSNSTITSCYNIGTVSGAKVSNTSSYVCIGGIVGYSGSAANDPNHVSTIAGCYNAALISGSGNCNVGGVSGVNDSSRIENSYNTGMLTGSGANANVGGVAGGSSNAGTIINCYNIGAVSGSGAGDYVCTGGVAGISSNTSTTTHCFNIGIVRGSSYVGGVIGRNYGGTLSYNYYSGYSGGVGQNDSTAADDVANGTIPFVSCENPGVGETKTIQETAFASLNSDFKNAFGITDIQYPDEYESSDTTVLTVNGRNVTRIKTGDAAIMGKAVANSNANIILSQNALNMADAASGFSGAGTATAVGAVVEMFAGQQTGTDKILSNIIFTNSITGSAIGAAKTADGLNLPATVILATDQGTVNASVTWDVNSCAYDSSKTAMQTFTVRGTVTLPTGVTNPNNVPLTVSVSVTVGASSGSDTHKTVTGFEALSDAVKNQTAAIGMAISSLNLPQKLKVAADGISGLWVRVSNWISNIPNSSIFSKTGTYTFIPVLDNTYHDSDYVDSGYTLANGVTPPNITVTVQGSSSNNHSSGTDGSSSSHTASQQTTQTQVDAASNTATVTTVPDSVTNAGSTAQIDVTVPSVTGGTGGTLDPGKVTISLPESVIVQQLNAKQNVDLTLSVPSSVAHQTSDHTAISIPVGSDVFAAAKTSASDLVINIKDADTKQLAYTWTFRGADLAKSTAPITDVNISMAIRLTTEVSQVNRLTPNITGLVLMFDHSGVLPSTASLTFSAKEKGFKPGQKLYFYFYNASAGQLESQAQEYTVDADGNVTVQISHCSNYVLLPNKARTITLDTRVYTMPVGDSYITGVKLTGVSGAKLKSYSSTKGVADVTVLKNGNVMATGKKTGITYVMIDVYDSKNKFLTHASVRLIITNSGKPKGNSQRQFGIF